MTLAEIRFGIERIDDAVKRVELNEWLTHKILPMFAQRVLAVTEDVMFRWRMLVEAGRKEGHTFSQPDLIIAATALEHGLTVVTRDRSDFERARVSVFDPWSDHNLMTEPNAADSDGCPATRTRHHVRPRVLRLRIKHSTRVVSIDERADRGARPSP